MPAHDHPSGEYCDDCRPILEADFGAGEQFWRHWVSPMIAFAPGALSRLKVLSKRLMIAGAPAFEFVAIREFGSGVKMQFGRGIFNTDEQLATFVKGMEFMLQGITGNAKFQLDLTDFRSCDTLAKWEYKMREGTTTFDVFHDMKERTQG